MSPLGGLGEVPLKVLGREAVAVERSVAEVDDSGLQSQLVGPDRDPAEPATDESRIVHVDPPANGMDQALGHTRATDGTAPNGPELSRFRRRAAILGGARGNILDRVPLEADRFTDLLPLLVAVAAVSGISMAFAIATGVLPGEPAAWFAAVPVALLWMALIFLVDRALTASMKSTRDIRTLAAIFIPRILIAAVIGAVVSGPLVLQVFARDIQQEMFNDNLAQGTQQSELLDTGPEQERLDDAREELANLRDQAATGNIVGVESSVSQATLDARERVATLEGQVALQREAYQSAQAIYSCSVDSSAPWVEGCVRDADVSFQRLYNDREAAAAGLSSLEGQLAQAQSTLAAAEETDSVKAASAAELNRSDAEARIPAAEAEYEAARSAYSAKSQAITATNAQAVGIIAQIRALERLQSRDWMVAGLHWLVGILFFLIELMPVLVKTFRSWGDPNPYELAETASTTAAAAQRAYEQGVMDDRLAHDRQRMIDHHEHEREDEQRHREARAAATLAVEQDMLDREVTLGQEQNARVAARMETVVGHALDEWEREVDRVFAEEPAAQSPITPILDEPSRRWNFSGRP